MRSPRSARACRPGGTCAQWIMADTGVTVDGSNNVTLWADQSGNGRDWTVGNGSVQLVLNAQNGLPVVRAAGSNNYLTTPAYFGGPQQAEVFVVIRANTPSGGTNYAWNGFSPEGPGCCVPHYPWQGFQIFESFGHTSRQGPIDVANNGNA